jgi:hypothetical protein
MFPPKAAAVAASIVQAIPVTFAGTGIAQQVYMERSNEDIVNMH